MTVWDEAREGIGGALQIARRDLSGLDRFNFTPEGFWRSFFAALLVAPLEIFQIVAFSPNGEPGVGGLHQAVIHILSYSLSWTAWPLAAFYLTRAANVGDKWLAYIIVYNWAQVPVAVGFTLMLILGAALGGLVVAIALLAVMVYEWYIAWKVLGCPGPVAAGFQLLNLALLFIINSFALAAMGMQPATPAG